MNCNHRAALKIPVIAVVVSVAVLISVICSGCNRGAAPEKPAAASGITGVVWKLAAIQRPGGAETSVAPEPLYSVLFDANGRLSGQANCNRHAGQYKLPAPGTITLTAGASTRMMCLGESIENEFLKTLGTITNYETSAEKLILSSGDGAKLTFTGEGNTKE